MLQTNSSLLVEILKDLKLPHLEHNVSRVLEILSPENRHKISNTDIADGFDDDSLDDIFLHLKNADKSNAEGLAEKVRALQI